MSENLKENKLRGRDFLQSSYDDELLEEYFLEYSNSEENSALDIGEGSNSNYDVVEDSNSGLDVVEDLNSVLDVVEDSNSGLDIGENSNSDYKVGEDSNSGSGVDNNENHNQKKGRDYLGNDEDLNSGLDIGEDLNSVLEASKNSNSGPEVSENSNSGSGVNDNENHNHKKGRDYLGNDEDLNSGLDIGEDLNSVLEASENSNSGSGVNDNENHNQKRGREYLVNDEDSYPKITLLSSKEKYFDLSSVESSKGGYIIAGFTTLAIPAAGAASLYYSLISQLGKTQVGDKNVKVTESLAKTIVHNNFFTFILMNRDKVNEISGVGAKKIGPIMDFYAPFISKVILYEKLFNTLPDFVKAFHEPNQDNLINLAVDTVDVVGTYCQYRPVALVPISHSVYLAYKGDYAQAAGKLIMASSYVLPYIMTPANPVSLVILVGIGAYTAYNLYTSLNDYINDKDSLKSTKAYEELYQNLSETPIEFINDFASKKAQECDIAISKIEQENIEVYLTNKGDFGKKLYEHIYLLSLSKEAKDGSTLKHAVIKLSEDRAYDHCIEVKAVIDYHNTHYNCYNKALEVIDRVVIGEDDTLTSASTIL